MKKSVLISLLLLAVAAYLLSAATADRAANFKQAEDFPRGALLYVQIRDLPALVKLWNESDLRRKYLESANYRDFQKSHLALKLADRVLEINEAVGIYADLNFGVGLSENKAALAVYDIGKMEFVFIAPMSEEKIPASSLFRRQANFEEIPLADGTLVYAREIEVDRARQRQKILFANFRGRLIFSTSEKYFLQTLDNIRGNTPRNRLSAEPLFSQVAEKTAPRLATVWLNQQKLNDDWYFRHYWLMSAPEELNNLRSGMSDFAVENEKIVERRVFATSGKTRPAKIENADLRRLSLLIPDNLPFYAIRRVEKGRVEEQIVEALFESKADDKPRNRSPSRGFPYFEDWEKSYGYSYLDEDFSVRIDETEDEFFFAETNEPWSVELGNIIAPADPAAALELHSPVILTAPLFFENRRALIFTLRKPSALNRARLENSLARAAARRLTVSLRTDQFRWTDFAAENISARGLSFPSLGRQIFYQLRGGELIFSNSEVLLREINAPRESSSKIEKTVDELVVVNFRSGRDSFDKLFGMLEKDWQPPSNIDNFFTGNIGSLLDVVSAVDKIEISRTRDDNFLSETIEYFVKKQTP